MRAYIRVTGILFALVTVAHLARTGEIRHHLTDDPWFVAGYTALTLLAALMAAWAWRLERRFPSGT